MTWINNKDFGMENLKKHYERIDQEEEIKCDNEPSCNGVKWFVESSNELGNPMVYPCPSCHSRGLNDE